MKPSDLRVSRFKGLNSVGDPMRLGLDWLTTANNININDTGGIERRDGYTKRSAGVISGAYGTLDHQRLYLIDTGILKDVNGASIGTISSSAQMHWTEINDQVYFNNGTDSGIIGADNTLLPWSWRVPGSPKLAAVTGSLAPGKYDVVCTFVMDNGRETGAGSPTSIDIAEGQALQISGIPQAAGMTARVYIAPANSTVYQLAYEGYDTARTWNYSPNSLGIDLMTDDFDPLPQGATVIQVWRGRVYAAQYIPASDTTIIWPSQPLAYHLFNLSEDYLAVPGKVLMLAPTDSALVIGTDKAIHAWSGEQMTRLASYGVVPGWCWARDDEDEGKSVHIWSQRGVCKAMPFANLTSGHVSVAPGVQAGAAVIAQGGQKRFVVALHQGGQAFNQR